MPRAKSSNPKRNAGISLNQIEIESLSRVASKLDFSVSKIVSLLVENYLPILEEEFSMGTMEEPDYFIPNVIIPDEEAAKRLLRVSNPSDRWNWSNNKLVGTGWEQEMMEEDYIRDGYWHKHIDGTVSRTDRELDSETIKQQTIILANYPNQNAIDSDFPSWQQWSTRKSLGVNIKVMQLGDEWEAFGEDGSCLCLPQPTEEEARKKGEEAYNRVMGILDGTLEERVWVYFEEGSWVARSAWSGLLGEGVSEEEAYRVGCIKWNIDHPDDLINVPPDPPNTVSVLIGHYVSFGENPPKKDSKVERVFSSRLSAETWMHNKAWAITDDDRPDFYTVSEALLETP